MKLFTLARIAEDRDECVDMISLGVEKYLQKSFAITLPIILSKLDYMPVLTDGSYYYIPKEKQL